MNSGVWTTIAKDRRWFVGGSDARIIMGHDEAALLRLWREKRGEAEPEDLSSNLLVQLGLATEELNRRWYEANTGQAITDTQRHVRHPTVRWMGATLDGRVEATGAVFEAKFMLPWSFSEEAAAEKYYGPAAAQHVGRSFPGRRAVGDYRRRRVGGVDVSANGLDGISPACAARAIFSLDAGVFEAEGLPHPHFRR